jgi:circadian clock protein KaiC
MSAEDRVTIRKLPTGVSGLDEILGGGLPEYSFNIIAGAPGSGKTTLAHQVVFANATPARPALYFTVLGEPALKMLRYQQQFRFFDPAKLNAAVRFVNLSQVVLEKDLDAVPGEVVKEVEAATPAVVVVDSFRTVVRKAQAGTGEMELQGFVQRLALHLTSWQATTFLIGEYVEGEIRDNPVFTVADGLFWLYQQVERNAVVRKLQVMKLRGQASVPGLHTFRITDAGLQAFPRNFGLTGRTEKTRDRRRLSCGIAELDEMLGGGIPAGIACWWRGRRGRGSRSSRPSSSPMASAGGRRGSWPSSRSGRRSTRAGRPAWGWIWKRRFAKESSTSSTSAPSTSPSMRRCARSSTRSRGRARGGW